MGAAGDQNPLSHGAQYFTPSLETGSNETSQQSGLPILDWLGKQLYFDVKAAIRDIDQEQSACDVAYSYAASAIPAKDGGDYPINLQCLRIGSVALVGFSGEMFNEIGAKALECSPLEDTLWVNLCWTREGQMNNYHYDDALTIASRNARRSMGYLPGYLQDAMGGLMKEVVSQSLVQAAN